MIPSTRDLEQIMNSSRCIGHSWSLLICVVIIKHLKILFVHALIRLASQIFEFPFQPFSQDYGLTALTPLMLSALILHVSGGTYVDSEHQFFEKHFHRRHLLALKNPSRKNLTILNRMISVPLILLIQNIRCKTLWGT